MWVPPRFLLDQVGAGRTANSDSLSVDIGDRRGCSHTVLAAPGDDPFRPGGVPRYRSDADRRNPSRVFSSTEMAGYFGHLDDRLSDPESDRRIG